jgi:hypothetical protein
VKKTVLLVLAALYAAPALAQPKGEEAEDPDPLGANTFINQGEVCPDPQQPCLDVERFKPNELSFRIASKFNFDRARDFSRHFYAVILKTGELCKIPDAERVAAQELFPTRKVFLHQHLCEGFHDKVTYTNVRRRFGFIAVYAGKTEAEAKAFLGEARARFPGASLRRMQVTITYQME